MKNVKQYKLLTKVILNVTEIIIIFIYIEFIHIRIIY